MGFWANKVNGGQAPAAPRPYDPGIVPAGLGRDPQGAVDHYIERQQGGRGPMAPQGPSGDPYAGWEQVPNAQATRMSEVLPIWQYRGNPRGGAGETQTTGDCPECGSTNFFSMRGNQIYSSSVGGMVSPAPTCYDCGYPREQGTLNGASVKMAGAAQSARSAPRTDYMPEGTLAPLAFKN